MSKSVSAVLRFLGVVLFIGAASNQGWLHQSPNDLGWWGAVAWALATLLPGQPAE